MGYEPARSDRRSRLSVLFGSLSAPRKIGTVVLALATAIATLWGAVEAVQKATETYSDARRDAHPSQYARTPTLGLELWQADKKVALFDGVDPPGSNSTRAELDTAPFEIRFPVAYARPGLRVAAWTDRSANRVEPGKPADLTSGNSFLADGYGMADVLLDYRSGRTRQFSELAGQSIYLVMWVDTNNDRNVDGEYEYVQLDF